MAEGLVIIPTYNEIENIDAIVRAVFDLPRDYHVLIVDDGSTDHSLDNLQEFHAMESKKEADKLCAQCHNQGGDSPLPENHPDPYRCLFCHKR